jgi:hypothetical protein
LKDDLSGLSSFGKIGVQKKSDIVKIDDDTQEFISETCRRYGSDLMKATKEWIRSSTLSYCCNSGAMM